MLGMHPLWHPLRHYKNVGADTCIFKSTHIQKGGGGKSSNHCRSRVLWERTVRDPNGCCRPEAHSATAEINSELISKQYLQREWFKNGKPDFMHFLPARKLGSYKFTEISNENNENWDSSTCRKIKDGHVERMRSRLLNQGRTGLDRTIIIKDKNGILWILKCFLCSYKCLEL